MHHRNIKLALAALQLAVLVSALASVQAERECKRLKYNQYLLFSTKTRYEVARRIVAQGEDLPKSFAESSLEFEDTELSELTCKPVLFYFIGRHAARFPDAEDIEEYNKKLVQLREVLRSKKENTSDCSPIYREIYNWNPKMQPKLDNLITEPGAVEERAIAKRFKKLYPQFFDTKTADIRIGVTSKLRTAQTAAEFLREVNGLNLDSGCQRTPTNDITKPDYNTESILNSSCYKSLMDINKLDFLEFHKQCEKIGGKDEGHPDLNKVKNPAILSEMINKISKRLELPATYKMDKDTLDSIYEMCKFETATINESIWCNLFDKEDLEAFEYIKDAGTYLKDAYGPDARPKQACPLIKDLLQAVNSSFSMTGADGEKKRSYFYFTHAEVIKKVFGAMRLFKDKDSYKESRLDEFVESKEIDDDRDWRSSLTVPFSANMAFVVYKCPNSSDGELRHRVIATVTERPVKLKGCGSSRCRGTTFLKQNKDMLDCNLESICVKSAVK